MAFSKAPTQDTYSSPRVSLFREITLRDGGQSGKDEDYLNVYFALVKDGKTGDQRRFIVKRSGSSSIINSVGATSIRGMHFGTDSNKLFYCVSNDVYVYNVATAVTTTLSNVFSTTTGDVGFTEFLYDDGTVKMVASDGTATTGIITIDSSNTVATANDVDLPAHDPNIVFLDGYLFVAESNSSRIYNSENNNPLSFTADAWISPEQEPDQVVRLAKINNYIIAFGSTSIEYYWDAANAAPDSPLQRNDTPIKINSYLGGFAIYGNSIFFIGANANGQPDLFELKDFKLEPLGNPSISRYLSADTDNIDQWHGAIMAIGGHVFYVVNAGSNKTWAVDLDTKMVTRFAYKTNSIFDVTHTTNIFNASSTRTYFALDGDSAIYRFDETLYQDSGTNFTCKVVTENNDFGTLNRKTMSRMTIIGDRPSANSNLSVEISDNDYQSFTTARDLNLNQDLPCLRQLGSFRQRIFRFTYSDNYPMRIQDVEVDINKGTS